MKIKTASGSHETQREWVHHRIRGDLMRGRYAPGERLTIARLSEDLGVSMTPVREALNRLAAEGALVVDPNRSMSVPRPSLDELLTVRQVREMVEGLAARRAAERISVARLGRVQRIGAELEKARLQREPARILRLNEEFHFAVYESAAEPVLAGLIAMMWLRSAPSLHLLFSPDHISSYPLSEQNRSNLALIQALRVRDGDAAERAIVAEIALGSQLLRQLMSASVRRSGKSIGERP